MQSPGLPSPPRVPRANLSRRQAGVLPADRGLRLAWPGRVWEPGDGLDGQSSDQNVGVRADEWHADAPANAREHGARLVQGDALDVARALAAEGVEGKVDLVYVDPPFASQAAYVHEARLDGAADGRVIRAAAYDDRWERNGIGPYLDMLAPRLDALAGLLGPAGTIWVHVDYRASYFVRLILDEILGRGAFVNEIVWRRAPNLGRQAASHQFGRTLDTILVYGRERARLVPPTRLEPIEPSAVRHDGEGRPFTSAPRGDYTDDSISRLEKEGRVHRTASGKAYVKYFLVKRRDGVYCRERRVDALWTDIAPLRHARSSERTGYPTQKPRALLDRIITCASPPGGLVVDLFGGSGTTAESAHALGRRFVSGDASPLAIGTARARLLRAGAPLVVETCGPVQPPTAEAPALPVELRVGRTDDGATIELCAPREPLAWAVDAAYASPARSGLPMPFRTAWHSERSLGSRTKAVTRETTIVRAPAGGPGASADAKPARSFAVRVWLDDGRVGTLVVDWDAPLSSIVDVQRGPPGLASDVPGPQQLGGELP